MESSTEIWHARVILLRTSSLLHLRLLPSVSLSMVCRRCGVSDFPEMPDSLAFAMAVSMAGVMSSFGISCSLGMGFATSRDDFSL
mgnify:CR=1 FL=1